MNEVAARIAEEIRARGPIPFARFMEVALYCPVYGYYEKEEDTVGRGGDYYTSVSVGPLFGQLLACQFAAWIEQLGPMCDQAGQLVEAGAHNGKLARDILAWLREHRPDLYQRLQYWIIEPSPRRRAWQKRMLAEFVDKVQWAAELRPQAEGSSPAPGSPKDQAGCVAADCAAQKGPVRGIIFSNELLDAMPVHRLGWDARLRRWVEWGVTLDQDRFAWVRLDSEFGSQLPAWLAVGVPNAPGAPRSTLDELAAVLPDGFTIEWSPAAEQWWHSVAGLLETGKLLTFDYGLTAEEFLMPERAGGTLRAYSRHQPSVDLLARPGEQDLTAHVNFTQIQSAGESAGLRTEAFSTQTQFLTQVAAQIWEGKLTFGAWGQAQTRQFQTLTHPEHLGRSFRVLVQAAHRWAHP